MYKLILAEDEDIIREGIIRSISWDELGFEIVADASDGDIALEKIRLFRPEVLLTDIKMPNMDGMELIENVVAEFPETKIIILSGFNEVEYLHQAIKNSVTNYLLKPVDYDEFISTFKSLKEQLDEESERKKEYLELKQRLSESLPLMKERFLNSYVKGYFNNNKDIEEKKKFYGLDFIDGNIVIILIELDNYHVNFNECTEEKKQLILLTIVHIANRVFEELKSSVFFVGDSYQIMGICNSENSQKVILSSIQRIQKELLEFEKITISVGISNECRDVSRIKNAYNQAKQAVDQKIFLGSESIVFYADIENIENPELINFSFDNTSIINAMYHGNETVLENLLSEGFKYFSSKTLKQTEYFDKLCLELLFQASRYAQQFNIQVEEVLSKNNMTFLDIFKIDSLEYKKKWLLKILLEISNKISKLRNEGSSRIVNEVKGFIDENYMHNSISLDLLSEKFKKNADYLGRLFKLQTGENFIDYVTNLRIETAKKFLKESNMKLYEISSNIGYADVSHFTKTFKKRTGMSPSEFRDMP